MMSVVTYIEMVLWLLVVAEMTQGCAHACACVSRKAMRTRKRRLRKET